MGPLFTLYESSLDPLQHVDDTSQKALGELLFQHDLTRTPRFVVLIHSLNYARPLKGKIWLRNIISLTHVSRRYVTVSA